jgi:3'(2'), 5'-bisphosphate nucleotidase
MRHYEGQAGEVGRYIKGDGSDVTDADLASEKIVLAGLLALTPGIPIISEEGVERGEVPDISGGTFWVVDPLDGTLNFIDRNGGFSVAIALLVDRVPVLGVVAHPALGWTYVAVRGGRAEKINREGQRFALGGGTGAAEGKVLVTRYTDMPVVAPFLAERYGVTGGFEMGSGISRACRIAEGEGALAPVYIRAAGGRSCWWDVAPGHVILEAAGGQVVGFDGAPVAYDAADLRVAPHVLRAPRKVAR